MFKVQPVQSTVVKEVQGQLIQLGGAKVKSVLEAADKIVRRVWLR